MTGRGLCLCVTLLLTAVPASAQDAKAPDAKAPDARKPDAPPANREGGNRRRNPFNYEGGQVDPNGPKPVVAKTTDGQEITFDYSAAPDLKEWVETKLKPVCLDWYPKIVALLPSENYEAPKKFTIFFSNDYRGVAATGGNKIVCATGWFKKELDREAVGAVVHEMVHVVQQYGRARASGTANRNPGWLVEGLADYIRWFLYEPESLRPRPRADRANYNDSYRTTGHFLNYVLHKYDKDVVKKLNAAMREGKYNDDLWKQSTGRTLEELGQEWKETLPGSERKPDAPTPK
jgi:hypothetical protein